MALSADLASHISQRFRQKHKLLLCPNSRSEGDAQQMATELVNRFYFNHSALPAIALTADALILAYIDNDSASKDVFSRQGETPGGARRYPGLNQFKRQFCY